MAEQVINDVVKEAQSVGRPMPIDDTASSTSILAINGAVTTHKFIQTCPNATQANGALTTLNIDADEHSATESQSAADASGGSDTDISRPGSVDQSRQEVGDLRTNSVVKKPSTFKSVSFTKNFLAKSAVSTPTMRLGDKGASAVQTNSSTSLVAKPRLVAKSGAGNTPRSLGNVNGPGVGPDASKVWNKNQPVPPPPPKQFTDEELKQQYGIHLATRLQADEIGKEAKWADIDDDEDDWAPEAVQWMDGTKSSLSAVDTRPLPSEEPKAILKSETAAGTLKSHTSSAIHATKLGVTGGNKTILKPGAHTQSVPSKSSLVLKGQPEKPTLVSKPSTTEKKSPWATLPPIEKVPPVQINPPQQVSQPRFSQRDSHNYESVPSTPAKEIAPDDFNRSWRDDRGNRELYNSQSGRYEPVNDMRRNSIRESSFRQQPSVLQRPAQDGPAEPSAAFQTSRSSADMPAWGRRRNSSNVSGDLGRRMSIDRRTDIPRGSVNGEPHLVNGHDTSDSGPYRQGRAMQATSPSAHPVSPHGSVTSSGPHEIPASNSAPAENPVEAQRRLMADKIERARMKKQQEREAEMKEEAERKERLAKRLAAIHPLPEAKPKTEQSPSHASDHGQKEKTAPVAMKSPPKPPVPTADGEIAQYGMIKVHQAQPVTKALTAEPKAQVGTPSALPGKAQGESSAKVPITQNHHAVQASDTSAHDNDRARQTIDQSKSAPHHVETAATSAQKSQTAQPPAWTSATAPQSRSWTSQVWGAPNKPRALGNGTFDSRFGGQQQQHSGPTPTAPSATPIGMNMTQQPQSVSQSANQLPQRQQMYPQTSPLPPQGAAPTQSGRIAPPIVNGWANFETQIQQDDAGVASRARQDRERVGDSFRPEIREVYKDPRGQTQTTLHEKVNGNTALPENGIKKDDTAHSVKSGHDLSNSQQHLSQNAHLQQGSGPRASRFFPRPSEAPAPAATSTSSKADSPPPPPETAAHPAFTGDTVHPTVRLPKPSPIVRLPPSSSAHDTYAEPVMNTPSRGQSFGARPLAMNPEWQARFNKLLEKPTSGPTSGPNVRSAPSAMPAAPTKPGALAPAALSKSTLDVRGNANSATVSLPYAPLSQTFSDDRGKDVVTRRDTEALFEDREFGSLPTVRLSKGSHVAAILPPAKSIGDEVNFRYKKFENPFTMRRLEAFDIEKLATKIEVIINIPGTRASISKSMPRRRRGLKHHIVPKPKQNSISSNGHNGGPKDRPRKSAQQNLGNQTTVSPQTSTPNAWGTNTRTTTSHAQTWAALAAASVH